MPEIMTVNGSEYRVIKLPGKGKGTDIRGSAQS